MLERNVNMLTALLLSAVGLLLGMLLAAITLRHFFSRPVGGLQLFPTYVARQSVSAPMAKTTATASYAVLPPEKAKKGHGYGEHKGWNKHDEEGRQGDD